jgi:chromate transporter
LGQRSITDIATVLLALVTVGLLWKFKKLPEPLVVAAAAVIGLLVYPGA